MDSSGHSADSEGTPHPKVIDFLGVFIAILTLTLPLYTISLYSSQGSPQGFQQGAQSGPRPSSPWVIGHSEKARSLLSP